MSAPDVPIDDLQLAICQARGVVDLLSSFLFNNGVSTPAVADGVDALRVLLVNVAALADEVESGLAEERLSAPDLPPTKQPRKRVVRS